MRAKEILIAPSAALRIVVLLQVHRLSIDEQFSCANLFGGHASGTCHDDAREACRRWHMFVAHAYLYNTSFVHNDHKYKLTINREPRSEQAG